MGIMTPPKCERARAPLLVTALGLVAVPLAAAVLLGLSGHRAEAEVAMAPSVASTSRGQVERAAARRATAPGAAVPDRQLFARTSFWNKRLPPTVPLDASSTGLVRRLVPEVERERTAGIGPWIGTGQGSTPVYRVGAAQTRVRVRLDRPGSKAAKALQRAFASVPIPSDAKPAVPPDRHMTVWQPSTDALWEFFGAHREPDGWHARWGGAIRGVSMSRGYYTSAAWPGATRAWGATASGLPVIGGTMLLDELETGHIDHALALNLPASRAGVFAWPAQRTDGVGPPTALPEGARLRLDAALDLGALRMPKLTRMIARAAQR